MKYSRLTMLLLLVLITISCHSKTKELKTVAQVSNSNKSVEKVSKYLDQIGESNFIGSITLIVGGEIVLKKSYGYSDKSANIRNSFSTVFDIGSVTKQFTAAAILKLEMQGKLSTSDKISKYFKNTNSAYNDITIHHLLTHSSGIIQAIGDDYEAISDDGFIEKTFAQKLLFTPGSAYEYSNVGYSLLGLIIEKVSGMSYENYLYQNLWKPSGMENTGYSRPNYKSSKIAVGYNKNDMALGKPNEQPWAEDAPYWHLKANGGVLSTAEDLAKWHLALRANKILSNDAIKKYFTPYVKEGEEDSMYSYGWAIYKSSRNTRVAAHNGSNGIFFADFWRYLDDDIGIIMITNKFTQYSEIINSQIAASYFIDHYKPMLPQDMSRLQIEDSDENSTEIDSLVESIVSALQKDDENVWKKLITEKGTKSFINLAPMDIHLKLFKKFHNKLENGQLADVEVDNDEIIVKVQTPNTIETLVVNFERDNDGGIKFAGIMIE